MKWTPDDHGCIYDETGCFARLTPNKAERLASRHNDNIDALTAEVDELQRRLSAVVEALKPAQIKWSKASMDSPEYHAWCLIVPLYGATVAIAEGREG